MSADEADGYVRERAAPPGSTLHYCTLFCGPEQARRSIVLAAFQHELDLVVDESREPAVIEARVGWWREELARLASGEPQHPVARVLAAAFTDAAAAAARLAPAVDATGAAAGRDSWPAAEDLEAFCLATGGASATLECELDADHEAALALGALLRRHDMLTVLFRKPRRGCQAIPRRDFDAAGVATGDLFVADVPEAAEKLLRETAESLRRRTLEAMQALPRDTEGSRVLLARAAVALATSAAIRRGGTRWLSRHAAVSPLHKLWIAWRCRRR